MPQLSPCADALAIPFLDAIAIDGDAADWGEHGFKVDIMASAAGDVKPPHDFDPRLRLAWNEAGLLLLALVRDDVPLESGDDSQLWNGDSVEVFLSTGAAPEQKYQAVISPGLDPEQSKLRTHLIDRSEGKGSQPPLTIESACRPMTGGYAPEALFPWSNLELSPKAGVEIKIRLLVNDSDRPGSRFQAEWGPEPGNPDAGYIVRLAHEPSAPHQTVAKARYENLRWTRVDVTATEECVGQQIEVRDGGAVVVGTRLESSHGRAAASLRTKMPQEGDSSSSLELRCEGVRLAALDLSDASEQRARALTNAELNIRAVFDGTTFPQPEMANPLLVEEAIGRYSLRTTYYDTDYRQVNTAEKPGRYGAVIDIVPETGQPFRRFRTLYRSPHGVPWLADGAITEVALPYAAVLGVSPVVAAEQAASSGAFFIDRFRESLFRNSNGAALVAGLAETVEGSEPATFADDFAARDRQWWVGLKRRLYGLDSGSASHFDAPQRVTGHPAPVLEDGSVSEAEVAPNAVEKIDAVCQDWAANSDEAFAVCIARHGVVFYHRAFGTRNGERMMVRTKSWMASITKLICGTMMMMLVDQGLVELDDPVEKHLPPFRGVSLQKPLTIRDLYTHTNGLWDHWGDDLHDFEEIIAGYGSHLRVRQQHSYNGAGYTLAGKIMELKTGEALPQLYWNHLLEPLGCTNTEIRSTSWDARSIPLDIARIGQMLLNTGAYGNLRFFSGETFQQLLPVSLKPLLGPDTDIEWGIGATWYGGEGLGKGAFGHGAASAATLRIDPENDLVVVMTRNSAGSNFDKYHPRFMEAITQSLAR